MISKYILYPNLSTRSIEALQIDWQTTSNNFDQKLDQLSSLSLSVSVQVVYLQIMIMTGQNLFRSSILLRTIIVRYNWITPIHTNKQNIPLYIHIHIYSYYIYIDRQMYERTFTYVLLIHRIIYNKQQKERERESESSLTALRAKAFIVDIAFRGMVSLPLSSPLYFAHCVEVQETLADV